MLHRITVPIDSNSTWDKSWNESQVCSLEPSADEKGNFVIHLQLTNERVSFYYKDIETMMSEYEKLNANVGNGFQSTHTIMNATSVSSNGKTLLG